MGIVQNFAESRIDGDVAKAMLAQSPQCIKLIDSSGRLRFMSENGRKLMEIDDFSMVEGKVWWSLWPDKSRATLENAVAAANRGLTVEFEAECPTAGGRNRHWSVRVSPVSGGELDGMVVAASEDISDRVALQEARDRLETDNRMLRRFGRFVAHDLRGPIRHHRLLSEMIVDMAQEGGNDADATAYAAQINESAAALLQLLSGLESLHEVEEASGKDRRQVSLPDVVGQAMEVMGQPGLRLNLDCEERPFRANRGQMISIFSNLLDNARKYARPGSLCTVDVTGTVLPDDTLEIVVADDGPGFAEDRIEDVFAPLVRQSNGTGISGSGLGLALVERIVKGHGGTVEIVTDRPDGRTGATIRIRLPVGSKPEEGEECHG